MALPGRKAGEVVLTLPSVDPEAVLSDPCGEEAVLVNFSPCVKTKIIRLSIK